ncbi:hypothetical protein EJ05DRAFT_477930 [Pseudovirgaria hyperparasitica]|uniref:25S rRNA adenine-N(1) methyltransferase n=1 Tax=Pseudovirgaria hyperparasitica TaxID=470096 RepID=A0A6A6W030_9PEZI|nr:uncharacterized protein EJ05DRAFT_477930 [Pseudovirgaria hyperparasitica]KAF2755865.1 hypothetical protein EJ05DRAFT_477930 [Pseudovirgaria hyperparasitica]
MPSRRPKLLSSSRPRPLNRIAKATSRTPTLSAKKGRSLIRAFHTLRKQHAAALVAGDGKKATEYEAQMDALGGLEAYQKASLNGQGKERGGDSSGVLVGWLSKGAATELGSGTGKRKRAADPNGVEKQRNVRRVLEVGCLSTTNAVSKMRGVHMDRLDLHSQDAQIEQQDFMQRPIPTDESKKYDVVSLSLVLNYVPDAEGKGEMLRRTCEFLRKPNHEVQEEEEEANTEEELYPCLFLVLPAPCVHNSRYLDEAHLARIMNSLGYSLIRQKLSSKLTYTLWRWDGWEASSKQKFNKEELKPGGARNNFCIVLK